MRVVHLIFMIAFPMAIHSQNPFIRHMYTADPSARVFGDRLYIYPSPTVLSGIHWGSSC